MLVINLDGYILKCNCVKTLVEEGKEIAHAVATGDAEKIGEVVGGVTFSVALGAAGKGAGMVAKGLSSSDEFALFAKTAKAARIPRMTTKIPVAPNNVLDETLGVADEVLEVTDDVYELYRKASNTGDFKDLKELMQLKHVKNVADKAGIGLDGIKIKIDRNPQLIGREFYGYTDGKTILLAPDAFVDTETLIRTLGHERIHVYQVRVFGKPTSTNMLRDFEKAAFSSEDNWWNYYLFKNEGER